MVNSGSFQIIFRLKDNVTATIGALGHFVFPAGYYVFTGKSNNRLESVLIHHGRKKKKIRFHMDYLSVQPAFEIVKIYVYPNVFDSCLIHQLTLRETDGHELIPRFGGASDDNCFSHLLFVTKNPQHALLKMKKSFRQEVWENPNA